MDQAQEGGEEVKHLTVVTSAEATITESWLFGVPDDFDPDAFEDEQEMFDQAQKQGEILDVKNVDVTNERDREVEEVRVDA